MARHLLTAVLLLTACMTALCHAPDAGAYTAYLKNGETMEVTGHRAEGDNVIVRMKGGEAAFDRSQFDLDKTSRDHDAYVLLLTGAQKQMDAGKPDEAAKLYRGVVAKSPDDVKVRALLADALAKSGQFEDAIYEYRRVQELDPDAKHIKTRLGEIYYQQGDYYEAIDRFLIAIDEDPDDREAHLGLGMSYSKQEMFEGAKTELDKAVALKPDYAEAHAALGYVYFKKSEFTAALKELKEAVSLDAMLPEAQYYLGLVYGVLGVEASDSKRRLDYFDKSIDSFRQAVTLRNFYPEAHADLGVALYNRGAVARAVEEFNIAITQKPDMAVTHSNLAGIYNHSGFYEAAVSEARKALDIDPNLVGAFLIMGNAYANMKKYREAARAYDRYLYYSPSDPMSEEVRMRLERVVAEGGLELPLDDAETPPDGE